MNVRQYRLQDARMDYYKPFSKGWIMDWLLQSEQYHLRKYVRMLRSEEYFTSVRPCRLRRMWYARKKNVLGSRLGFFIPAGCFGADLKIAHYGSIIINPHSRIGRGCTIHGNCCIGNKGMESSAKDSPVIGDNVNIGQGAQILGSITVADNVTIAAGAILVKDIDVAGATVAGIPAKTM